MSQSPVRTQALRRLLAIEEKGAFSSFAGERLADSRDERGVMEYVAGITRWRRWLDFVVDHFYKGDADRLELTLRIVLRIGLYDLLYLSTPDHAALNEAVTLAKREVRPGAGGLTNGILRSVLRAGDDLPQPNTGVEFSDIAIEYSHPDWLVKRWMERYGRSHAVDLLDWNNTRPSFGLRVNSLKSTTKDLELTLEQLGLDFRTGRLDDFLIVTQLQSVLKSGAIDSGMCSIQDEAAAVVVRILDPKPGDIVLDLCAAPGGKSTYAAALMNNTGKVVAVDRHGGRLKMVADSAKTLGISIIDSVEADAVTYGDLPTADRVLLDAPCSGTGVLSKRADLRWRVALGKMKELTDLQDKLLDAAAGSVRNGGVLVYSTCTLEPEENEDRVASFLSRHPNFVVDGIVGIDESLKTEQGFYQSLPFKHKMDGAFAARLRRTD